MAPLRTRLPAGSRSVAVTFDDGPDPEFTPRVLDQLGQLDVVATFFLVGHRANAHPGLVRRIVDNGHAVGSHSQTHPEPGSLGWRIMTDFRAGRAAVERAAGQRTALFRPPKGFVDTREAIAIRAAGLVAWTWTIDPEDWQPGISSAQLLANVDGIRDGDVVLLHDGIEGPLAPEALDRSATVDALPALVEQIRARGLSFTYLPTR